MSDTKKEHDLVEGDEVLKRMLKTPPLPKKEKEAPANDQNKD